ncbi:hypothetical protein [Acrocarpospora macrocephala]|uniref:hypothetical protein n=1 Tax=Acrocarpospora macrocephala TaxID=150177 RepID=UPI0012D2E8A7|nr:hypothetical protein [Acrocarpospora macrocephala]
MIGLLAAIVAACSSGPSLEEAGSILVRDGNAVMAWDNWVDESITNVGSRDVYCSDDSGFKRVFTATGELPTLNPDPDNKLDGAARQIGARFAERGYLPDISSLDQSDLTDVRTIVWLKESAGLRFFFTLTLPSDTRISAHIKGETSCG